MAGKAQCVIGSTNLIRFPFIYEWQAFIILYLVGMGRTSGGQTGTAGYKPQLQKLSMRVITRGDPMFDQYKDDPMFDPKLGQGGVLTVSSGGVGKGQGGCSGDSGGPLFCTM